MKSGRRKRIPIEKKEVKTGTTQNRDRRPGQAGTRAVAVEDSTAEDRGDGWRWPPVQTQGETIRRREDKAD